MDGAVTTGRKTLRMGYALLALSLFDAAATDMGLRLQVIEDGNPVAKALYDASVALFFGYKLLLPLLLLLLLRYVPGRPYIRRGVTLVTGICALVALYHACWIFYMQSAR